MIGLPEFTLHRPDTLDEALELISPDDLPYVGGTELLLAMRERLLRPRSLVDLKGIEPMSSIDSSDDHIAFGGAVTHRTLARHPVVQDRLPILSQVLQRVGNPRVQTAGTPAGNLCFAEPKSDIIPLFIALDAQLELQSPTASRTSSVAEFVVGPYAADRAPDELLTSIRIPLDSDRIASYLKFQIMERPTVGVAAVRSSGRDRVVVGAAGMLPVAAEAATGEIDPDDLADAIDPMPDLTGSAEYKRHVTAVYVRRAVEALGEAA